MLFDLWSFSSQERRKMVHERPRYNATYNTIRNTWTTQTTTTEGLTWRTSSTLNSCTSLSSPQKRRYFLITTWTEMRAWESVALHLRYPRFEAAWAWAARAKTLGGHCELLRNKPNVLSSPSTRNVFSRNETDLCSLVNLISTLQIK